MTRGRFKAPPYDTGAAALHLRDSHPRVATLVERVGPCTLTTHTLPPYESLVQSIVYQQLNGRAAETILGRVLAIYAPKPFPAPADILATPDDRLRAAGLSRAKTAAVKSLAQHALDGVVPTRAQAVRLSNEELIERLTRVRGIGRWTVEMMLIFWLGRPDILPVDDLGIRKGVQIVLGHDEMLKPKELFAYGELWAPFRTAASLYLWRIADFDKDQVGAAKVKRSQD